MFKAIARIEHKIGDKVFQFICDGDSSIEHIKESLFQFSKHVAQIEDQIKASQQPAPVAPEEPKVEDGSVV